VSETTTAAPRAPRRTNGDPPQPILSPQPIFVGDIQGCADEFDELLARIRDRFGDDFSLYSVGDLINRGPDNLRVLERLRGLEEAGRARCVLGNHELHFLMAAFGLRGLGERDSLADVLESAERDDWVQWLRTRPIALVGGIGASAFALVHASVHPDWDLATLAREAGAVEALLGHVDLGIARALLALRPEEAPAGSPRDVLGRLVSGRSTRGADWSSALPDGASVAWHSDWSQRGHEYGVVYGHWALQGLHVAPGLRGLDTGCVHHGRGREGLLTAWLPTPTDATSNSAFAVPDDRLWHVRAHRHYYRP
jgi:bis(5'-nucleosyl)-tetraphosphatase (symmetrical)